MATSNAQRAATADRRRRAVDMRRRGADWDTIAETLGYAGKAAAHKDVTRALEANRADLAESAEAMRQGEIERLDALTRAAWTVLETEHVTVSHGRVIRRQVGWEVDGDGQVVRDGEGKPVPLYVDLLDDGPVLQAVDRLLRIAERRAKLLGLDAPTKIEHDGVVRYEIEGVSLDVLR